MYRQSHNTRGKRTLAKSLNLLFALFIALTLVVPSSPASATAAADETTDDDQETIVVSEQLMNALQVYAEGKPEISFVLELAETNPDQWRAWADSVVQKLPENYTNETFPATVEKMSEENIDANTAEGLHYILSNNAEAYDEIKTLLPEDLQMAVYAQDAYTTWWEQNSSPASQGKGLREFVEEIAGGSPDGISLVAEAEAVRSKFLERAAMDPPTECKCGILSSYQGTPMDYTEEPLLRDVDDGGSFSARHWIYWKAIAWGAAHSGVLTRTARQKQIAAEHERENRALVDAMLVCLKGNSKNDLIFCEECAPGTLWRYGEYSAFLQVTNDVGQIWSRGANAAASDAGKLDFTGDGGSTNLFNKGAALAINYDSSWDVQAIMDSVKAFANLIWDPQNLVDLVNDTVKSLLGLVQHNGQKGTKSQTIVVNHSDSAPLSMRPWRVYTLNMSTHGKVHGSGYGGESVANAEYHNAYALGMAIHYPNKCNASVMKPAAVWAYGDVGTPTAIAGDLQSRLRSFFRLRLPFAPVNVTGTPGYYP